MALPEIFIHVSWWIIDTWIQEEFEYFLVELQVANFLSEIRLYSKKI